MGRSARADLLGVLAAGALTVLLGLPALGWPASSTDEMMLLVHPIRVAGGDLPYRDFFGAYGPAHWWFLAAVVKLLGPGVVAMRLVGLGLHVALVVATHRVALRLGSPGQAAASGCLAALLLFRLGDGPYAWVTAVLLCLVQLAVLSGGQTGRGRAVLAGLAGGLAIAFRPDAALLAVVPALVLVRASRSTRAWTVGAALGMTPLWVSLALTPGGWLGDIVLGRASRGAGQSRSPLPTDLDQRLLLGLVVLCVALGLLTAAVTRTPLLVALALLGLLAVPQALQRAERIHFLYAALACVPFLPQLLSLLLSDARLRLERPGRLATACVVLVVLPTTWTSVLRPVLDTATGQGLTSVAVRHDGRVLPESTRRAAALRRLLPVLDRLTTPRSRLFVFDEDLVRPAVTDLAVYYLMPHTRQLAHTLEINPGTTNAVGSHLAQDVADADVLVLLDARPDERHGVFPYEKDGPGDAQHVVDNDFCQVAQVEFYRVLTRCTR